MDLSRPFSRRVIMNMFQHAAQPWCPHFGIMGSAVGSRHIMHSGVDVGVMAVACGAAAAGDVSCIPAVLEMTTSTAEDGGDGWGRVGMKE